MSFQYDDFYVTHQLIVGDGYPVTVLKTGEEKVRGGSSFEGPVVIGSPNLWTQETATLMVGPDINIDSDTPKIDGFIKARGQWNHSPYSFHVVGDAIINNYLDVYKDINAGSNIRAGGSIFSDADVDVTGSIKAGGTISANGDIIALVGSPFPAPHSLAAKKNFDIPHPSKKGWRLRHTCLEGPSNDVFIRGRLNNESEIILPEYWKDFVDHTSITVSLTPIGSYQTIIVKAITPEKVILQSKGLLPIHCFYHVYAMRKDGDILIPEYEGNSPDDYPGNNSEYTINK